MFGAIAFAALLFLLSSSDKNEKNEKNKKNEKNENEEDLEILNAILNTNFENFFKKIDAAILDFLEFRTFPSKTNINKLLLKYQEEKLKLEKLISTKITKHPLLKEANISLVNFLLDRMKNLEDLRVENIKIQEDIKIAKEKLNKILIYGNKVKLNEAVLREGYYKYWLEQTNELLSNIDGKSLDEQQRRVVITEADNTLVVAGAGSGKTLTIASKVKFLVDILKVDPQKILLITFTKKAADEMEERIKLKLGIEVKIKTFHSLGYDILSKYENIKKDVFDKMKIFISEFKKEVLAERKLADDILEYIGLYLYDNGVSESDFENLSDYYAYNEKVILDTLAVKVKAYELGKFGNEILEVILDKDTDISAKIDFINIKMKKEDDIKKKLLSNMVILLKDLNFSENKENFDIKQEIQKIIQRNKLSLASAIGERLKSLEEVQIANYLFQNGIKYEYEKKYKYDTADRFHRQYKPDFYLPEYDLYIEHYGIDENGRCPQYNEIYEKKYLESMEWKRETHKKNNTKCVETYSYEAKNGSLFKKLDSIFEEYGIKKNKLPQETIYKIIKEIDEQDREYAEFFKLLQTFLSLFKSKYETKEDLDNLLKDFEYEDTCLKYLKKNELYSDKWRVRVHKFLLIFKVFFDKYDKKLKKENMIDFNDMIRKGVKYIYKDGLDEKYKFDYIIIDEFQDISFPRYELIKAIRDNKDLKILAVGDDWQSIYRFAGSDISLFTKFEKYFGETELLKIEKTYRNSQELIDFTGNFIMKNCEQIQKTLKSDKRLEKPIKLYENTNNFDEKNFNNILLDIILAILLEIKNNNKENEENKENKENKRNEENKEKTILILGRNRSDINLLKKCEFLLVHPKKKIKLKENYFLTPKERKQPKYLALLKKIKINFLTVHRSKGLEADEVILINNSDHLAGFPNKLLDDPVINILLAEPELYLYAEERRLFYVALTRTKTYVHLIYPTNCSTFIKEVKNYPNKNLINKIESHDKKDEINLKCPKCQGKLKTKTNHKTNLEFWGCEHYPQCRFSMSLIPNEELACCPKCNNYLIKRSKRSEKNEKSEFFGCLSYPYCTFNTKNIEKYKLFKPNKDVDILF